MIGLPEFAVLAFFGSVALSLFTCGFILTDRRRIAHRFAWAVIALLLPPIGPILYLAFGRIDVPVPGGNPPPLPSRFAP